MKVLLDCRSSHDDTCGCDYALVDLSPKTARAFLDRHKRFMKLRSTSEALNVRWLSGHAEYFSPDGDIYAELDSRPTKEATERVARVLELLDGKNYAVVPDDFEIPDSMVARTECEELAVCRDGVWFSCVPKHTDVVVETRLLPVAMLTKAAAKSKKEVNRG
jgi:hypothetical protein